MKHSLERLSTQSRAHKLGEPWPRQVPQSHNFIGLHTEAVSMHQSHQLSWGGSLGENCPSSQLAAHHGGNCPPLVWEVLRQDFASGQVLDGCNFLVECLACNWILANASAGDVSMLLMLRLMRSEKQSQQETEHTEPSTIQRVHHCVASYNMVPFWSPAV